jgi:diguanylate cyclase (GGDEF)-like protein
MTAAIPPVGAFQTAPGHLPLNRPGDGADDDGVAEQTRAGPGPAATTVAVTAVAAAVSAAAYVVLPAPADEVLFQVVAWGSIALFARWIRRGAIEASWVLIGAGFTSFAVGDLVWALNEHVLDVDPFPSLADVAYLLGYPLLAAGLAALTRRTSDGRARSALIDAGIVLVPAVVAAWLHLVEPLAADRELTVLERTVSMAYPVGDVICLAVLVRLAFGLAGRSRTGQPACGILLGAFVVMLGADVWFLVATLHGDGTTSSFADALFLVPYVGLAGAAAHPSVARIGRDGGAPGPTLGRARLGLLAAAALVTPGILLVQWAAGEPLAVPLVVAGTTITFLLVVARISELVEALERTQEVLRFDAGHDPLTRLPNRRRFTAEVEAVLAVRRGGALLFIDLDRFKHVNDELGHQAGDDLLVEVAARLRSSVRAGDVVARLAGDEFVVLVVTDSDTEVLLLAQRVLAALAIERSTDAGAVAVTASVGVVRWDGDDTTRTAASLLAQADRAMYEAKGAAGNQLALAQR